VSYRAAAGEAKTPYLPPTRTEYEALITWLDPAEHPVSTYNEPLAQAHADLKSVFDTLILGTSQCSAMLALRQCLLSVNVPPCSDGQTKCQGSYGTPCADERMLKCAYPFVLFFPSMLCQLMRIWCSLIT